MTAAWDCDEALRVADGMDLWWPSPAAALLRAADAEIARLQTQVEAAEKMAEALRERDGGVHDADCKIMRKRPPMVCTCGHGQARAALAAWEASREARA